MAEWLHGRAGLAAKPPRGMCRNIGTRTRPYALVVVAASRMPFYIAVYKMTSLLCQCGDEFRAQCDEQATGFSIAWVLLFMYAALHIMYIRAYDSDSDDSECESTMYS